MTLGSCKLSRKDLDFIDSEVDHNTITIKQLAACSGFNIGDILVLFETVFNWGNDEEERRLSKNSYNAPNKFIVVFIDNNKIPYVKKLDKRAMPCGSIISCLTGRNSLNEKEYDNFHFELDSDYADAIILDSKKDYDASHTHRDKSDIFKEIGRHNKAIKIECRKLEVLCNFFDGLNVGDVIWSSSKKSYTISAITKIARKQLPYNSCLRNMQRPNFTQITATDSRGKELSLLPNYFQYKALYKARPRSYTELKDPNL